jgi:hypothetical protein
MVETLGLVIASLTLIKASKIDGRDSDIVVVGAERLLANCQTALKEWLGLDISARADVEHSEIIQRLCDIAVVGT